MKTGGGLKKQAILLAFLMNAAFLPAQDAPITLNDAISGAVAYLEARIPEESKLVVLNIVSKNGALSDYIINSITEKIVNDNFFTAVDRHNLDLIQNEITFQMSGEVSDETAQAIGQKLGAESIISGSITAIGDLYRFQIRAIEVKTAKIQGIQSYLIANDAILSAITGRRRGLGSSLTAKEGDWKNKWLYAGARIGSGIHFYDNSGGIFAGEKAGGGISFDAAPQIAVQLLDFLAIQTEVIFSADTFTVSAKEPVTDSAGSVIYHYDTVFTITSNSLLIPVLLNFTYFPARYSLGVSGGIFFGAPMKAAMFDSFLNKSYAGTLSAAVGLAGGINAGIKIGPGVLFADIRYMADLVNTTFTGDEISVTAYRRGILGISLGYSIGFFQKNN
ncbi:MAG: CsgG/HfaB family protein [Spirochaetaceae bacterium]|nr:CsgG/HfaB family protein [Spirochaetaceae bacterium]